MNRLNWQQLLDMLRPILHTGKADANKATILSYLEAYTSDERDYKPYVFFDQTGYTKNSVEDFDFQASVIVMCWAPRQESAFHSHEGSKCFVKVLQGSLIEQQVPYPSGKTSSDEVRQRSLSINDVTYIDDSIGLHKVANKSSSLPAITLHIYLPAYTKARIFDPRDICLDKSKTLDVTYYSKSGTPVSV